MGKGLSLYFFPEEKALARVEKIEGEILCQKCENGRDEKFAFYGRETAMTFDQETAKSFLRIHFHYC